MSPNLIRVDSIGKELGGKEISILGLQIFFLRVLGIGGKNLKKPKDLVLITRETNFHWLKEKVGIRGKWRFRPR